MDRAAERFHREHPETPFEEQPGDGYSSGGYEWCILAWGTKRDADVIDSSPYDPTSGSITIQFCTAWSPPLPWLECVASHWPDLGFRLYPEELGEGWAIEIEYQGGRKVLVRRRSPVVSDTEDEPNWGPWEELPQSIRSGRGMRSRHGLPNGRWLFIECVKGPSSRGFWPSTSASSQAMSDDTSSGSPPAILTGSRH